MKNKGLRFLLVFALVQVLAVSAFSKTRAELVRGAVSENENERAVAIRELRSMGVEGLNALFDAYSAEIATFTKSSKPDGDWPLITSALDSVAMQKDVYASRLFWHTDLNEAVAEAKRTNKPILSLRLLGNLNEEFSCANSRFFRALLYSNSSISRYLRENYVLHWKSVRPAPKVTIDFGDGRKLERTLTGNSIHYILSPDAEVIDALPGLYDPGAFLGYLTRGHDFSAQLLNTPAERRGPALNGYRRNQFYSIRSRREDAIARTKVVLKEAEEPKTARAIDIGPIAVTKMATEATILRDLDDNFARFEPQIPSGDWQKLAAEYAGTIDLDASSLAFIKRQNRELEARQFENMISKLKTIVALDTTRNDFLLHTELIRRLNNFRGKFLLENFNSTIYSDLFKTPDADKWLGLYTDDVYTALDGNGRRD
ncbi:MAG: hypothetical protein IPN69_16815 [Acidobacteria bacterium]|nr:hypothetical protein [Acidobacteriota bacterium]